MPQNIAKIAEGQIEYRFEVNGLTVVVLNGGHCSRDTRLSHERLIGHGFSVYMNGCPTRTCCAPNTLRAPSAGMLNDGIFDVQPPWGTCLIFKHFFRSFQLVPSKWPSLVPPQETNTYRWPALLVEKSFGRRRGVYAEICLHKQ